MTRAPSSPPEVPPLAIATDKVCYIVVKAREFDAKEADSDPDSGSNPTDDGMASVLEDERDDPVLEELTVFIDGLNEDEQVDLVALAWLGRGDGTLEDWADLQREAQRAHNENTAGYLLGLPLLADYLEEALSAFDLSCEDFERGHL